MVAKTDIELRKIGDYYTVFLSGKKIVVIQSYDNPFHERNCYLKVSMNESPNDLALEIFRQISEQIGRPLQVMVDSSDRQLASFLTAAGFICCRKCYETEGTSDDYVGIRLNMPICIAQRGDTVYEHCCEMMYRYYQKVHAAINPLTASFEDFCDKLPQSVCYEMQDAKIIHCAFFDENEIAYVCSDKIGDFLRFAEKLICWLFSYYPAICFESDDCDTLTMQMRTLFINQSEASYNTYVYDYKRNLS